MKTVSGSRGMSYKEKDDTKRPTVKERELKEDKITRCELLGVKDDVITDQFC